MKINARDKYAQPEVIDCWRNLSKEGLQKSEWEMVRRYLPAPDEGPLLDIGCGAGRAVLALSREGYAVTGIDLSLPMLLAGRRLSANMPLSGGDLLALPFAGGAFGAALMFFGALQHIPGRANRRRALAETARVTRPQARLILGLDNLAPSLTCYGYWLKRKFFPRDPQPRKIVPQTTTAADATLWGRRAHPLAWHARGLARALRWRTWPGLIDRLRRLRSNPGGKEPGDVRVAQFSLRATPGTVYYHLYDAADLIEDAGGAGWRLLGHHSGRELSEGEIYPPSVRRQDKQQFFAFEKTLTAADQSEPPNTARP